MKRSRYEDQINRVYYKVPRPKGGPVLVNAYVPVDGNSLKNVDPLDKLAVEEDLADGIQIMLHQSNATIDGKTYKCEVIPREFTGGLFYAMIMEPNQRKFVARLEGLGNFVSVEDTHDRERENARQAKWYSRPLYQLPGNGTWVLGQDRILRRYGETPGAQEEKVAFSAVEHVAEEADVKCQVPVRVMREDGSHVKDTAYFVECEHGLIPPWGWLVTIRRVDGDETETAVGYKTPLGVRILQSDEAVRAAEAARAAEAVRAAEAMREDAAESAPSAPSADVAGHALRNAGGKRLFGRMEGDKLTLKNGGHEYAYDMTWLDRGSYNRVGVPSVGKVDVPDVLIRLTDPDKCPTRADFEREVRFAIAIADRGIGPAIYATLDVGARRGLAMERFPYTLDDVAKCPRLMRRAFVESDGETALVDLYVRSSALIRCVDTRSANVVVRFDPLRLALIDVDPKFCLEQGAYGIPAPTSNGPFGVGDLEKALGEHASGVYGHAQWNTAAMSLLVHCIDAANQKKTGRFGVGYPLVAECLLKHMDTIWPLLEAEAASNSTKYPALIMARQYYGGLRGPDQLTREMVEERLGIAMSLGHMITLCRDPPNGELYEEAALAFYARAHRPDLSVKDQDGLRRDIRVFGNDARPGCRRTLHPPTPKHRFGTWI